MTPLDSSKLELMAEISKLKRQNAQLIKEKLALRIERDDWKKKFEQLSVTKIKTVRITLDGQEK